MLFDQPVLAWFVGHRSAWNVDVAKMTTFFGNAVVLFALALVALVVLRRLGARWPLACAPLVSFLVTGPVVAVLKALVARPRPPVDLHLVAESDASFPSGHAADSAAFFIALGIVVGLVLFRRPLYRALCVVAGAFVTFIIGISRLLLGVHWPVDVVVGWILGTLVAVVVTRTAMWWVDRSRRLS
jgi:undecaprenyl-diphosphatase